MMSKTPKQSRKAFFFWIAVVTIVVGVACILIGRLKNFHAVSDAVPGSASPADEIVSSGLQSIRGNGYAASVPDDWRIDQEGSDTVVAYDDGADCKIEISEFSYPQDGDTAQWIGARIGADPSLSVSERSSEDVTIVGGAGVRWNGMIDGMPTTLVYAFGGGHAYEIAPSSFAAASSSSEDEAAAGDAQCESPLDDFLSYFTISQTSR